jgi:DNA ligase (NAD+)
MDKQIGKLISKITKYDESRLKQYFNTENLLVLHEMKLHADDLYYNTDKPSGFSDWQYDMLKETLLKRDPTYVVPVGVKIRHHENRATLPFWLGSMDKLKPDDDREIAQWIVNNKAKSYIIEDKLDGVSCLMTIKDGKLKLYTRGDGIVGADISYLAQYFSTLPRELSVTMNIRGELIMKKQVFENKYKGKYANPRNMVAGMVGAKTVRKGLKDIDFIAYEIVGDGIMMKPSKQLEYMDKLGFTTVRREIVPSFNIDSLMETMIRFKETSPYEIDGIIVQPDISYERNTTGNPDYAFAFKMRLTENLIQTRVIGVEWNVSKWGQLKPRVQIEPVSLGGTTIKWVTGFNAKFIVEESIGADAVIEVTRSGDVIPYIVKVLKRAVKPELPDISYHWNDTRVDIIADEMDNIMCVKLISDFFAKLGIKQLGERNVAKIYSSGLDTLLKIISATQEDFTHVEGFGDKMAEKVYTNIQNGLQNVSLSTVLGASGVFGFGLGQKKITALLVDFPDILSVYKKLSKEDLLVRILEIEGFSDKSAQKIVENVEWADRFITALKHFATFKTVAVEGDNLKNMKIVFTGFRDKVLEEEVEKRGGKIVSSVSKNTTILVVSALSKNPSGKLKKALDLGVKVVTKEEFITEYIK